MKRVANPGATILAVDYDLGRNGFAYFDRDTANYWVANGGKHTNGNKGRSYRNDGVDITRENDLFFVDSFEQGEWLQYTSVATSVRKFNLILSVAAKSNGKIRIDCNGYQEEKKFTRPGQWHNLKFNAIPFRKGANVIRVKCTEGELKFLSMKFE
jgi:hypothetical protein